MRRVYLDNAGSGLASKEQLEACSESIKNLMLSNPHSRHATAQQTHAIVENARARVLKFFDISSDDYSVVFTSNTTQALKLVAESFKYGNNMGEAKMAKLEDSTSCFCLAN